MILDKSSDLPPACLQAPGRETDPAGGGPQSARGFYDLLVLSTVLFTSRSEDQIAELTATTVPLLVKVRAAALLSLSPEGDWKVFAAKTPPRGAMRMTSTLLDFCRQRGKQFIASSSYSIITEKDRDYRALQDAGLLQPFLFPVKTAYSHLGIIMVDRAEERFAESDIFLLQMLAGHSAIAMGNVRLFDQQTASIKQLEAKERLIVQQNQELEHILDIHLTITRLIIDNHGLPAVVEALAGLIGSPVLVSDRFFNPLAWAPQDRFRDNPKEVLSQINAKEGAGTPAPLPESRVRNVKINVDNEITEYSYISILVSGELMGYLIIAAACASSPATLMAVERGAGVLALKFMKQRVTVEVEQRLHAGLFEELLEGKVQDSRSLMQRAAYYGYNLSQPHQVMLLAPDETSPAWRNAGDDRRSKLFDRMYSLLKLAMSDRGETVLLAKSDFFLIISRAGCAAGGHEAIWQRLRRIIKEEIPGLTVSLTTGTLCQSLEDYRRSYLEAKTCLEVIRAFNHCDCSLSFNHLGVYRLLHNVDQEQILLFTRDTLGKLLDYDREYNYELVPTLHTYLECSGNCHETARKMHLHVGTVKYRLRRIAEVAGVNLSLPQERLNLHLALQFRHMIAQG